MDARFEVGLIALRHSVGRAGTAILNWNDGRALRTEKKAIQLIDMQLQEIGRQLGEVVHPSIRESLLRRKYELETGRPRHVATAEEIEKRREARSSQEPKP